MELSLNSTELNSLFPFHFTLNRQLEIVSVGNSLQKVIPVALFNKSFESSFKFKRPILSISYSYKSISEHLNHLFILDVLNIESNLSLRGQFILIAHGEILFFAGSPWLKDVDDLEILKLKINDFAISDNITDLIHLLKSQNFAIFDAKSLAEDLKSERDSQKKTIEFLFKEVHHRVKNNLQIVISLINLQKENIKDLKTLFSLQECQNRIYAMAAIHEALYAKDMHSSININEYIKKLILNLIKTYQVNYEIKYKIEVEIESDILDFMVPLSLISNEIISNILKYAFTEKSTNNTITFVLKESQNKTFCLLIGDNGIGHNIDFEAESSGLGIELIKIFTSQIDGKIRKIPTKGTLYELTF